MRRFINSLLGRAVCQLVILSLVMPFYTVVMASRAEAQLQTLPTWAVVDFEVLRPGGDNLGSVAAEAVANELAKSGKYDIVPQETIKRTMEQLTLQPPVKEKVSLLRLAGEVRASTIVRGEVNNWRVRNEAGGKKADVIMRVEVVDVASGLPVNGAALSGSSSVRASSVDDATVIAEAIASAAAQAVAQINTTTLPQATILNTFTDTALINHGARSGFAKGQQLIVTRGREQVATASVMEVDPDSATIKIERAYRGHAPGDKVRVIVQVPQVKSDWNTQGEARIVKPKSRNSNSGFTTMLLVFGVLGVLLSNGRSSSFSAAHDVKAEAMMFPNESGAPATRVSWSRDLFVRGNQTTVLWQIYRSDVVGSPVLTVIGNESQGFDTTDARDVTWGDFGSVIGGTTCDNTSVPETTTTGVAGVSPGRTYTYSVALVYKVASIDLPDGGGTGTGGTGGGTGASDCFFISKKNAAKGPATPLSPAQLQSPSSNQQVASDIPFVFNSVVNPAFPQAIFYALEISTDPNFPRSRTKTYATFTRADTGTLSTGSISGLLTRLRSDFGTSANEFWWRIGARGMADKPGPVADANGERFIFCPARRFTIPAPPPPPPAE